MKTAAITSHTASQLVEVSRVRVPFITELAWSADNRYCAVAGGDGVRVWQGTLISQSHHVIALEAPAKSIVFMPEHRLAIACVDGWLRLFVLDNGQALAALRLSATAALTCVTALENERLAVGTGDGTLFLIQHADNALHVEAQLQAHMGELSALTFHSPDHLVTAARDNTARLWMLSTQSSSYTFAHSDWVRDIDTSGNTLAVACKDGTIYLWSLTDGTHLQSWNAHEGGVDAVAFSPDGALLASGGRDQFVYLWNVTNGERVAQLSGHTKPVLTVAFNSSGTSLASGSGDNTVRVWQVQNG